MIAELRIPIDNEAVLAFWQAQANQHGRSLEEEISMVLNRGAFRPSRQEVEEKLAALREKIRSECGALPDSTALIREERDTKG